VSLGRLRFQQRKKIQCCQISWQKIVNARVTGYFTTAAVTTTITTAPISISNFNGIF